MVRVQIGARGEKVNLIGHLVTWIGGIILGFSLCNLSHAETFATAKNNSNGEIVLLDTQGNCVKGSLQMFTRIGTGEVTMGCWFYNEPYIYVTYVNGIQRVYDSNGWTLSPKYKSKDGKGLM